MMCSPVVVTSVALSGLRMTVPLNVTEPFEEDALPVRSASVLTLSVPAWVMRYLYLVMLARASAAPARTGLPLPVGLLVAAGRLALGLTSVAEGAGVCEPPPQADRDTAATAVRIMRPRPCRCATPNMRPPLVP